MSRLIIPLFLMCMAGIIGLSIVAPQYDEIRLKQAEEAALLKDIEDAQTINEKVDALRTQYANFPPEAERKLAVMIPEGLDMVRLIIDVTAVLQGQGFSIGTPSVSITNGDGTGPAASTVNFTVTATYNEFRELLSAFERSLAIRDLTTVSFNAGEVMGGHAQVNQNGEPVRSYALQFTTYAYSPQ